MFTNFTGWKSSLMSLVSSLIEDLPKANMGTISTDNKTLITMNAIPFCDWFSDNYPFVDARGSPLRTKDKKK